MSDRSFLALIVLGLLAATVAIKAPVRELDPAATVHRMAAARVADIERSIWASWAAVPPAALDFPIVGNPDDQWLGPVRTPSAQVASSAAPVVAEGVAE